MSSQASACCRTPQVTSLPAGGTTTQLPGRRCCSRAALPTPVQLHSTGRWRRHYANASKPYTVPASAITRLWKGRCIPLRLCRHAARPTSSTSFSEGCPELRTTMKRAGVGCTRPAVGRETHTALRERHSCILSSVYVRQQEKMLQWVYVRIEVLSKSCSAAYVALSSCCH
jgi:hypothetical protein